MAGGHIESPHFAGISVHVGDDAHIVPRHQFRCISGYTLQIFYMRGDVGIAPYNAQHNHGSTHICLQPESPVHEWTSDFIIEQALKILMHIVEHTQIFRFLGRLHRNPASAPPKIAARSRNKLSSPNSVVPLENAPNTRVNPYKIAPSASPTTKALPRFRKIAAKAPIVDAKKSTITTLPRMNPSGRRPETTSPDASSKSPREIPRAIMLPIAAFVASSIGAATVFFSLPLDTKKPSF